MQKNKLVGGILKEYFRQFPEEKAKLTLIQQQVADGEEPGDRENYRGHVVGDGIVLSPDQKSLLMVHHNTFNFWLQPGGHWDPEDATPRDAAIREVGEETGLQNFEQVEWLPGHPLVPIDIDTHVIPASTKKGYPEHYHHSFAYVMQAKTEGLKAQEEEVSEVKWIPVEKVKSMNKWHFPRVISKLEQRGLIIKV